jgi:hypothetical protein
VKGFHAKNKYIKNLEKKKFGKNEMMFGLLFECCSVQVKVKKYFVKVETGAAKYPIRKH